MKPTLVKLGLTSFNSTAFVRSAPDTSNNTNGNNRAVKLYDTKELSPFYIDGNGLRRNLADTPNPKQTISKMLTSGNYELSDIENVSGGYTYSLITVGLDGGRKLAATIAMLDNCLQKSFPIVDHIDPI